MPSESGSETAFLGENDSVENYDRDRYAPSPDSVMAPLLKKGVVQSPVEKTVEEPLVEERQPFMASNNMDARTEARRPQRQQAYIYLDPAADKYDESIEYVWPFEAPILDDDAEACLRMFNNVKAEREQMQEMLAALREAAKDASLVMMLLRAQYDEEMRRYSRMADKLCDLFEEKKRMKAQREAQEEEQAQEEEVAEDEEDVFNPCV